MILHYRSTQPFRIPDAFRMLPLLSFFSLAMTSLALSAEPPAKEEQQEVAEIVAKFSTGWDDAAWEPIMGRMSKYIRPTNDTGWKLRIQTLQALARHEKKAGSVLRSVVREGSSPARAVAAQALGFCGDAEAKIELAFAAEHDADPMVRLYAVDSLGMLGGRDHDPLFLRLEKSEKNGDVRRHVRYAIDREGEPVKGDVVAQLKQWDTGQAASAKLGEPAPYFELLSLSGEKVRLSSFRGKSAVVLVFVYGDT